MDVDCRRGEFLRSSNHDIHTDLVKTVNKQSFFLVRASVRSVDNLKHVYIVPAAEQWKVAAGLKRLKSGTLLRGSCSMTVMSNADANHLMNLIGIA